MTMPTGHARESELRWTASPMWLAMMDAAVACGVEDRMDEARITDAKVWAKKGDPHWPSEDKAVRDRFQLLWTANVQARCGIDPYEVSTPSTLAVAALEAGARPEEVAEAVGMHADYVRTLGRTRGVRADRSRAARDANAVRWSDPTQRAKQAEVMRRVVAKRAEDRHAA